MENRGMLVRFAARAEIFLISKVFTQALGFTHPSIEWVKAAISSYVKRPVHENDRSPPVMSKLRTSGATPQFTIRRRGL
jgi:hypothetical protein